MHDYQNWTHSKWGNNVQGCISAASSSGLVTFLIIRRGWNYAFHLNPVLLEIERMSHCELVHVYSFFCTSKLLYLLRKLELIAAIKHGRLCRSIWKINLIPLQLEKSSLSFLLHISMFRLTENSFCNLNNIFMWHKEIQFLTNCVWLGLLKL